VDDLPTPEEEAEQDEIRERVRAALRQLSPRQRAAVVQRYFLEMSEQQMAEALESPPGTVKWLLNAARDKLRSILNSERNSAL
jgi:RNA polymerase sigma-70 factor, ECF subfamily